MSLIVNIPPASGLTRQSTSVIGAAVSTVTFSGLSGDTDGGYLLEAFIFSPAGNSIFTLQPNGLTTNQLTKRLNNDGATVTPTSTGLLVLANGATNRFSSIRAVFASKSGRNRALHVQAMTGVAGSCQMDLYEGQWDETATATVITSLVINSSVASSIGIGSLFVLTNLGNPLF